MNGLKDEIVLEIKEKTTISGFFFDTHKDDNEGQIILAIDSVSATELAEYSQKQQNNQKTVTSTNTSTSTSTSGTVTVTNIQSTGESVSLEAKYWDQLEQWLLKNYEKHFKNLAIEVAKVRFTMDAYTQQMEFSLNQQLQGWSSYLDRLVQERINVEISRRINQHINQYVDQTFEQKINNNIGLIINNIVNKQELNQYIDRHVAQQIDSTFDQKIRNNIGLIVNNIVNKQELNQHIDRQVNQQIDSSFDQKIHNNIDVITQNIVNNNAALNQYVSQQIDNTYEQKIQNYTQLITQNIVNNNEELNQYIDQRLQQNVTNNTDINNEIVNLVVNSTEINNKINNVYSDIDNKIENVRNEWNRTFINLVTQHVDQLIAIIGDRETFNIQIANLINVKVDELVNQILRTKNELTAIINNSDRHLYEWTLGELMEIKGCLTDRQVLVEQLVTFSAELRTKLDSTNCVDINTFKPFKPISFDPKQLSTVQPQQLPGS